MSRACWKGPFIDYTLLKQLKLLEQGTLPNIKIRAVNSMILPIFVGQSIYLYNGKKFLPINIKTEMVGFKFGEFVSTRYFYKHKMKKKVKKLK